jgi:hypothetical protein
MTIGRRTEAALLISSFPWRPSREPREIAGRRLSASGVFLALLFFLDQAMPLVMPMAFLLLVLQVEVLYPCSPLARLGPSRDSVLEPFAALVSPAHLALLLQIRSVPPTGPARRAGAGVEALPKGRPRILAYISSTAASASEKTRPCLAASVA